MQEDGHKPGAGGRSGPFCGCPLPLFPEPASSGDVRRWHPLHFGPETPGNRGRQRPGGWQRGKPGAPRAPASPPPRPPRSRSLAPQRSGSLGAVFPERDSALSLRLRASPSREALCLGEWRPQADGWTHGLPLPAGWGLESPTHRPSCQAGGSLWGGSRLNRLSIKPRVPVGKEREREGSLPYGAHSLGRVPFCWLFKIYLLSPVLLRSD